MSRFFSYFTWLEVILLMVGLMSGILSLARELLLIAHPERQQQGWFLFWRCTLIAFIASSCWLWYAEHNRVIELQRRLDELTLPKLSFGDVGFSLAVVGDKNQDLLVTTSARISNQGAPSILDKWRVDIRFNDGRVIHGKLLTDPLPTESYTLGKPGSPIVLWGNAWLPLITRTQAVTSTNAAGGWIAAHFSDVARKDLYDKSSLVTYFTDVNGKEWSYESALMNINVDVIRLGDIPGVTKTTTSTK